MASPARRGRRALRVAAAMVGSLVLVLGVLFLDVRATPPNAPPSRCTGRVGAGSLEGGWKLPKRGANFAPYSELGWNLGRTYVHSQVHGIVLAAYAALHASHPELRFLYGETGLKNGGEFRPHRTHRNGTSVDFMTPVRDAAGAVTVLPTSATNEWGYGIDFDASGRWQGLDVDLEAIALHLAALRRAAEDAGAPITKVVLYPPLRRRLRSTSSWKHIAHLPFTKKQAWVRHDDHYHVDFGVECPR